MAMGERTWEVLVLVTLSCAACLMMFVGVSTWSELNQPMEVSSQGQGSVVEMPPWIYHEFAGREFRDVEDVGVLSKAHSYFDGLVDLVGSRLGSPFGLWSGEERRPVQELEVEDENGFVATVKSFFAGIGDTVKRWGQKTIAPPAILPATEPLGRFPESDLPPSPTLVSELTAVVGKVMEAYYADSVVAGEAKTCSGILEEQTKKLVKSLNHELGKKLCNGELQSVNEEKFCNFYRSHPKMATLMVFNKLEVDPVGVALMRTTTSELCASSNSKLVHSVHKVEKLAQRLRLISMREVGQNGFAVHEHEHGLQARHFDVEDGHSCKDCYLQGIHRLMKGIKTKLATICQAPTSCMAETCAFVQEHRYLTKTYLVLKIRAWEIISMACTVSCRSSPSYMLPHYPQMAVSEPHAPRGPSLPSFGHGFIPRLAIEHPRLMMTDPNMPISHPAEFEGFFSRRSSMCRRLARLQAFRRAMQLRGNFIDRVGESGLEGNGQAHLVVVVNGHPIGRGDVRGILSDLQSQMDTVVADIHSDSRPEPLSETVLKPLFERVQSISRDDSPMEETYRAEETPPVEFREAESEKPEEVSPVADILVPVEESDSTSTNNAAVVRDEETSASLDGNLGVSAILPVESYEEGSRAVM